MRKDEKAIVTVERAAGATIYCKNCGTVNPEIADYCLKCGRSLGEDAGAETQEVSPVEIALAARPAGGAYAGAKKNFMSRALVGVMAAGLVVMFSTFLLLAQTGKAVYHPESSTDGATPAYPNADSSQSAKGASGGMGLVPGVSSLALANDAVRKANALRLQMAVAQFYAENDRYPEAVSEIPGELLGFKADPNIYKYSVRQDPPGFRIEVVMEGNNVSGGNLVTEGGVTKYVYEGQ